MRLSRKLFAGLASAGAAVAVLAIGLPLAAADEDPRPRFAGLEQLAEGESAHVSHGGCAGSLTYSVRSDGTSYPVGVATFTPDAGADCTGWDGPVRNTLEAAFKPGLGGVQLLTSARGLRPTESTTVTVVGAAEVWRASLVICPPTAASAEDCLRFTFAPDPSRIPLATPAPQP